MTAVPGLLRARGACAGDSLKALQRRAAGVASRAVAGHSMPGWRLLARAGAQVLGCGATGLGAAPGLGSRWVPARERVEGCAAHTTVSLDRGLSLCGRCVRSGRGHVSRGVTQIMKASFKGSKGCFNV